MGDRKVWLSGLPTIEDRQKRTEAATKLQEHISKKGAKCTHAEIWKNGNGVACFASPKDAQKALAEVGGSKFRGKGWRWMCGKRNKKTRKLVHDRDRLEFCQFVHK